MSLVNDPRFPKALELFNSGAWYEAHDAFEEIWHEQIDPERKLIQAIVQIAVAHVHLERGNTRGATILLGEGLGLGVTSTGNSECSIVLRSEEREAAGRRRRHKGAQNHNS